MNFLDALGIQKINLGSSTGRKWLGRNTNRKLTVISPVNGLTIAQVNQTTSAEYSRIIHTAQKAFIFWRSQPAPFRAEIVRQICVQIRRKKQALGELISYEMGKSLQEGLGEVQEMIDLGDFAVGLSRMLYGRTMPSERPNHRLYEQYQPLGLTGVITAFNFPLAVWAWNALIATVCGDVIIWKPSSKVPLTAIAAHKIIAEVIAENKLPEGLFSLIIGGGATLGGRLINDPQVPLISFTGSTKTGRKVSTTVASRFGRSILELGGNNAIILTEHANLKLAMPAIVFGAVGTAGQRCTSTRRLIVHATVYDQVRQSLVKAYKNLRIGTPLDPKNHIGPLIDQQAVDGYLQALKEAKRQGAKIIYGGSNLAGKGYESGCYVTPAIVEGNNDMPIIQQETFAPILYLLRYSGDITEAITIQNSVRQGLSSALFSSNLNEAETFIGPLGSDCGIANVNIGTSGAEIGSAFGGEKETGGGREAGSDAWKGYMKRQTVTINYGSDLPLAQGIKFDL